jgi:hypothetical protein
MFNKIITSIAVLAIYTGVVIGSTYYYAKKTIAPRTITQLVKYPVQQNTVQRDYQALSPVDCIKEVSLYDTSTFELDVYLFDRKLNKYRATAKLHKREAHRDFIPPLYQDDDWKIYLAAGAGVFIGGGLVYGGYRLFR